MSKCPNRTKKVFKFFTVKDKHSFVITNVFYTLENFNQLDVVKTCSFCSAKEALGMDRQTLVEVAQKFPHAFEEIVREFILSWTH